MRLLLVEDEETLRELTAKRLKEAGYSVDACGDGSDALHFLDMTDYDAVVLDIMLPGIDGLTLLRTLRHRGDATPVLLLTARASIEDRVEGLDGGADDYLVKPFSYEELIARIRVLLRRKKADAASNRLTATDLAMDLTARKVTRGGREIPLTQKEFAVLEYLLHNKGVVLSRDRIQEHIWNYDYEGASNVIDVYIRCLRKKIDEGCAQKLLHTVRGFGYVLREDGGPGE